MSTAEWTRNPERGSFTMMRVAMTALNIVGYHVGQAIGFLVTIYFFITGRVSRRASLDYLDQLHRFDPDQPRASLIRAFAHHAAFTVNLIDRMWFWQGRLDHFRFERHGGKEHLLERKRGMMLLGAHLGSFDAMRALSNERKLALNVVMYRANATKINRLLEHLDPEAGVRVIELEPGNIDQVFALKERIDSGELIAILGDRPAPHGRQRLLSQPFLGREAPFPQNPWVLASILECPVFFCRAIRTGKRRYDIAVEPMAEKVVLPRKTREEALRAYIADYTRRIEAICRQYPYQWFNFYPFWQAPAARAGDGGGAP